jgi:hypothetical protein
MPAGHARLCGVYDEGTNTLPISPRVQKRGGDPGLAVRYEVCHGLCRAGRMYMSRSSGWRGNYLFGLFASPHWCRYTIAASSSRSVEAGGGERAVVTDIAPCNRYRARNVCRQNASIATEHRGMNADHDNKGIGKDSRCLGIWSTRKHGRESSSEVWQLCRAVVMFVLETRAAPKPPTRKKSDRVMRKSLGKTLELWVRRG